MTPCPALRWPTLCCVCHGWARSRVCGACSARFAAPAERCRRCALRVPTGVHTCADCSAQPPPFSAAVAGADYGFPWQGVIGRFKFHEGLDVADALAGLLAQAVARRAAAAQPPPLPACVLPMPLGRRRLGERGFNQAALLGRLTAARLGLRFDDGLLQRVVETEHQAGLPRAARQAAVLGCFAVDPSRSHPLRGRPVALVDDVMTTGASAAEATRTLLAAGAASVQVWTFARTPPPSDA